MKHAARRIAISLTAILLTTPMVFASIPRLATDESESATAHASVMLRQIREVAPEGVNLNSAHVMADGRIAVHFSATDVRVAVRFKRNVEMSAIFENPVMVELKTQAGKAGHDVEGRMNFAVRTASGAGQGSLRPVSTTPSATAANPAKPIKADCRDDSLLEYATRLKRLIPAGVVVESIRLSGKQRLVVGGVARSGGEAGQLQRSLEASGEFGPARLQHMNRTVVGYSSNYRFDLDVTLGAACKA
jgi:Tfp pilus assembly protein PilN